MAPLPRRCVHTVFRRLVQLLVGDSSHHHVATTVPRKRGLWNQQGDPKNNWHQSSHRCLLDEAGHSRSTMATTCTSMVATALPVIAPLKQSVSDEITLGTFGFPKKAV